MALSPRAKRTLRRRLATLALAAIVFIAGALYARPPASLTIETGPIGGSYYQTALRYQELLAAKGITLNIKDNPNSLEIIHDVANANMDVDVGFIAQDIGGEKFNSVTDLGQIELQPLFIFASAELGRRSTINDLRGRRIVMPPMDSATSAAAIRVFQLYDITQENSSFSFQPLAVAVKDLRAGRFDAGVFMLAPSNASIRELAADSGLRLVPLAEAKAVSNHLPFLRPVLLPRGIYNIADAIPPNDTTMVAATVGVVARQNLHPYLVYALLEAMTQVHRRASFVSNAGEFPTLAGSQLTIDPLATQYYRSGVSWMYRELSPWAASIVDSYLLLIVGAYILTRIIVGLHSVSHLSTTGIVSTALWVLARIERSARRTGHISASQRAAVALAGRIACISSRRAQAEAILDRLHRVGRAAPSQAGR